MSIIEAYLNDAVTITPKGTLNADTTYAYDGTPVVTTGWVKKKTGLRKDRDGKEWMYRYTVYFNADETITMQDRITVGSDTFEVRDIEEQDDLTSTLDHYKVFCG